MNRPALLAATLVLTACAQSKKTEARFPGVALKPCTASGGIAALCGTYPVWENRAAGAGRKILLRLMVVPTLNGGRDAAPLFAIAGGPGQSAVDALQGFAVSFAATRDVVLVDQRGTGGSNPLSCDFDQGVADDFARLWPTELAASCRKQLETRADLRQYTTSIAMDDLDEVRGALGYDRIHVFGGSYGSTAALDYLRRHPEHVRTVAVEGVVPPSYKLPLPFAHTIQASAEAVFARCAADGRCRAGFPRLREEFLAVLERLAARPATFTLAEARLAQPVRASMSREMFVDFLRRILYDPAGIAALPSAIHSAWRGDFAPYAALCYRLSIRGKAEFPMGLYLSIVCNEGLPFLTPEEISHATEGTWLGDFRIRAQREICAAWPRADVPASFVEPVISDLPVLLISGALDPAAPPEYAEAAARSLSHSRHVVIPNGSHYSGPCVTGIVARFFARGSAEGLDSSCTDAIRLPPFQL